MKHKDVQVCSESNFCFSKTSCIVYNITLVDETNKFDVRLFSLIEKPAK